MNINVFNSNKLKIYLPICWENTTLTYSKTCKLDFEISFEEYWKFDYSNDESSIGKSIDISFDVAKEIMEKIGFELKYIDIDDFEKFKNLVANRLNENIPLIIHSDTYFLPWNGHYNQLHTNHLTIVKDYSMDNDIFYLVDADFPNDVFEMEGKILSQACKFYIEFEKKKEITKENVVEAFVEKVKKGELCKNNMINNLKQFATDFPNKFDYKKEYKEPYSPGEVLDSDIVKNLRNVIKGRYLYVVYLEYMENKLHINMEPVIELFLVSISKWNNIINLLFKDACTGWSMNYNSRIRTVIEQIISIEEAAADKLMQLINDYDSSFLLNNKNNGSHKCYPVDILKYSNNKGIALDIYDKYADLTGLGEYIIVSNKYANGKIFQHGLEYHIDIGKEKDNIVCNSQNIEININDKVSGIAILACTEWGKNRELVKCIDNNGQVYMMYINAFDLVEYNEEEVIDVGSSYNKYSNAKVRDKNVFTSNILYFENEIYLNRVILPFCVNLHIFSITLLK